MNTSAKLSELNARADCIIYPGAIKMQRSFSKQCVGGVHFSSRAHPRLHFAFAHNTRDKKLIPFQRQKPLGNLLHTDRFGSHRAKPFFALAGKGVYIYSNVQQCMQKNAPSWEQQPLSGFSLGRLNESQRGGRHSKGLRCMRAAI
jgi:hypothetical protein